MEIIPAALLMLITALIAALILAFASRYMGVKVDDTVRRVRNCLPGANCGACGYAGCDSYAEALAKGDVGPELCLPGGSEVARLTAEILGIDPCETRKLVAYVHCNGTPDVTQRTAEYDGLMTCSAMCLSCGGPGLCKYGCLGCGDCASKCPTDSIFIKNNIAIVDPEKCISCGICIKVCPKHIITFIPVEAKVAVICSSHDKGASTRKKCSAGCIACGKCERSCPYGAIKVIDNLAVIDYEKCTGCGICAEICPVSCISKLGKFNIKYRYKPTQNSDISK